MQKISFEFDPVEEAGLEIQIPKRKLKEALSECADFVKESVLSYVGEANSPVSGEGKFPELSKSYKKEKARISSRPIANLEATGAMLDSLEVVQLRGGKLSLQIEGPEAGKAESHCHFEGGSRNPRRRFIPGKGQTFKRPILDGIRNILLEYADEGKD